MKSNFSTYKYHNGKRWVGGTAAYNHFFKENGGIDNVMSQIATESAMKAIKSILKKFQTVNK